MNHLATDLDHVLEHTGGVWQELCGKRIFLTGGTGFFGCWLLESLLWANRKLGINARAVVLTRDPAAFGRKAPHLAKDRAVQLHPGDVVDFDFPEGQFTHVIHAASEMSTVNPADPTGLLESSFHGLRRVLELAKQRGTTKMLFASSGAIYGPAVQGRGSVCENDPSTQIPLGPRGVYAEGKRVAEMLGTVFSQQHGFEFKIARGFAFVGPYLPLHGHFAAGNFVRDALGGGPIVVRGSGKAVRSYLYGSDLAIWLWTKLCRGIAGRPYNLGSDVPVSVAQLATFVADRCDPKPPVQILGQIQAGEVVDSYVPNIERARTELGLDVNVPLTDAIQKTIKWHQRLKCRT